MKTFVAALLVSASFVGLAQAQEATPPQPEPTTTLSRAQVEQELAQAKSQGLWFNGQESDSNAFYSESASPSQAQPQSR